MTTLKTRMYYFGPWDRPGHYLFAEAGHQIWRHEHLIGFPAPWRAGNGIDGVMQPGCYEDRGQWRHRGPENEGEAILHRKDGWTAISFWDRSVDTRGACNSTYFAEGDFSFDQMAEMARTRFPERWNRMNFEVRLAGQSKEKER